VRDMYPGPDRGMYPIEADPSHYYGGGYGHPGMRHGMPHYAPPPQHHPGMYPPYSHHGSMYPPHPHSMPPPPHHLEGNGGLPTQGDLTPATSSSMMMGNAPGGGAKAAPVDVMGQNGSSSARASSADSIGTSVPPPMYGAGHYSTHGRPGPVGGAGPGYHHMPPGPMGAHNGMRPPPTGVAGLAASGNRSDTSHQLYMMQQHQLRAAGNGYPYPGAGMPGGTSAGFAAPGAPLPHGSPSRDEPAVRGAKATSVAPTEASGTVSDGSTAAAHPATE